MAKKKTTTNTNRLHPSLSKAKARTKVAKMSNNGEAFIYQGVVTIKLTRGKGNKEKVYKKFTSHNAGTNEFFKRILYAIAGSNVNQLGMPRYVHTYQDDVSHSTCAFSCPTNTTPLVGFNNESGYQLTFEFMIPYTILTGITNLICLYSTADFGEENDNNLLATYYLEPQDQVIADGKTNMYIEWVITIKNKE